MDIREYTPSQLDSVVAIFRSNIPKYFTPGEEDGLREFLSSDVRGDYFVWDNGSDVVGCGGIALNEDNTVSLCWGMVRSDHIGTGLGKAMTQFRLARAVEKFPDKAMVTSTSQHTEGFYVKLGFRTVEHTSDGFGPGIDICKMRREPVN